MSDPYHTCDDADGWVDCGGDKKRGRPRHAWTNTEGKNDKGGSDVAVVAVVVAVAVWAWRPMMWSVVATAVAWQILQRSRL